jgi:hypothetical protein
MTEMKPLRPAARLALLIALACTGVVSAQTVIYKVRYADGSIGFTDSPPRDAKILSRHEGRSDANVMSTPAPRAVDSERGSGGASPAAPAASTRSADLSAAFQDINDAQRDLDQARRALEAGREPLPGERLGLAGGGSRLSPAYDERVRGLEDAVAAAEARLKDAHSARNALR